MWRVVWPWRGKGCVLWSSKGKWSYRYQERARGLFVWLFAFHFIWFELRGKTEQEATTMTLGSQTEGSTLRMLAVQLWGIIFFLKFFEWIKQNKGLRWWLSSEESTCNAGDTGDVGSICGLKRSPGGEHGNPLQYSCLENPMERGTWEATVHGVAKSLTLMKWLRTHTSKR